MANFKDNATVHSEDKSPKATVVMLRARRFTEISRNMWLTVYTHLRIGSSFDECHWSLAVEHVSHGYHRGFQNIRVREQELLNFGGRDVMTSKFHHLLQSVDHENFAVLVVVGFVTGMQPS